MKKRFNIFFILLISLFCSCSSYKNIPYYQDLNRNAATQESIANYVPNTLQKGDMLGINVTSRSPESSAIFNYSSKDISSSVTGYVIDNNGAINLPLIGALKVDGMTLTALQGKLNEMLTPFYKDPVTNIRILNFRVAVYGDVLKPDVYVIKDEKITITQALTLAGDLNITAMRKNVILVREEEGKRKFIPVDLTSKNIFSSPYYYLRSNDEIYVTPDKTKYGTVERGTKTTSLILSGLSVAAIVLSIIYR